MEGEPVRRARAWGLGVSSQSSASAEVPTLCRLNQRNQQACTCCRVSPCCFQLESWHFLSCYLVLLLLLLLLITKQSQGWCALPASPWRPSLRCGKRRGQRAARPLASPALAGGDGGQWQQPSRNRVGRRDSEGRQRGKSNRKSGNLNWGGEGGRG